MNCDSPQGGKNSTTVKNRHVKTLLLPSHGFQLIRWEPDSSLGNIILFPFQKHHVSNMFQMLSTWCPSPPGNAATQGELPQPLKAKTQKEIKASKFRLVFFFFAVVFQTCGEIPPPLVLQCLMTDRSDQVNEEVAHIFGFTCACRSSHVLLIRSNLARAEDVRKLQSTRLSLNPRK